MKVEITGVKRNVTKDAPFIGAIIIAPDCWKDCSGCFHQHLRDKPTYKVGLEGLIKSVKDSIIDEGIILAGLEWTYNSEDMKALINKSIEQDLEVMLYTYNSEEEFKEKLPEIYQKDIWFKFGEYKEKLADEQYKSKEIELPTTNQYIVKNPSS